MKPLRLLAGLPLVPIALLFAAPAPKPAPAAEPASFVDPATPRDAAPLGPKGRWKLTFSDEFEGAALNPAKWETPTQDRGKGNNGVDWGWSAENVAVKSGYLVIAIKPDGSGGYRSGCARTRGLFEQQYGYFEARLKPGPKGAGHQAAFWLQSEKENKPGGAGGEIDVVETHLAADKCTSTLHWGGYRKGEHQSASRTWAAPKLHNDFHVYGVEWAPKSVRVYYDGELVWTHEGEGVPAAKEYLLCSVGILKWAQGDIRAAELPHHAQFDWVRVYRKAD